MMKQTLGCLAVVLTLSAPALAQTGTIPCGMAGQTKIFGCMDTINGVPSTSAPVVSGPIVVQGWALSQWSSQQPSSVQVAYAGPWQPNGQRPLIFLSPENYTITWRQARPDVAAYFSTLMAISSTQWGYAIVIPPGVIPDGETILVLRFTDPAVGVGINIQQVPITVAP